jgi:hypothetical protein
LKKKCRAKFNTSFVFNILKNENFLKRVTLFFLKYAPNHALTLSKGVKLTLLPTSTPTPVASSASYKAPAKAPLGAVVATASHLKTPPAGFDIAKS